MGARRSCSDLTAFVRRLLSVSGPELRTTRKSAQDNLKSLFSHKKANLKLANFRVYLELRKSPRDHFEGLDRRFSDLDGLNGLKRALSGPISRLFSTQKR